MKLQYAAILSLCALAGACASNAKGEAASAAPAEAPAVAGALPPSNPNEVYRPPKPKEKAAPEAKAAKPKKTSITIEASAIQLGDVIRRVGEQAGGNVVLMGGVESRIANNLDIKRRSLADAVPMIANAGNVAVEKHPQYFFFFPEGYEQLLNISLAGRLDAHYSAIKTDAVFGSGLPLCSVFMWMSYALKVSIIADNSVGDAQCGELALKQVPLDTAIEAILKSARVAAVQVESTPDYIFLSTPQNTNPKSALVEETALDETQKALLGKPVTLALPYPLRTGQPLELPLKPSPLGDVLPALSEQVGIRVVAEKGLEKFPVNPFFVQKVALREALDLLVRQWLEPNYGYQVLPDRIVIRRR
ncbi:MAG: hypothetical protein IT367_17900 [Candidatus Hydrogenedentes bacterium]|nr:hypothetical protein [Candidatus Hydrogenedentota bacterium]